MNIEYMNTLKEELSTVSDIIKKYGVYDFGYPESVDAIDYFVIMNNGDLFYIFPGSTCFPSIDFNDIVYIRKHITVNSIDTGCVKEYFDSDNGLFDCKDDYAYDSKIAKRYNADFDKEILTGNYD